jgi:hypothetical protein
MTVNTIFSGVFIYFGAHRVKYRLTRHMQGIILDILSDRVGMITKKYGRAKV